MSIVGPEENDQTLVGPIEDLAYFKKWSEEHGLTVREVSENEIVISGFAGRESNLLDVEFIPLVTQNKFAWTREVPPKAIKPIVKVLNQKDNAEVKDDDSGGKAAA